MQRKNYYRELFYLFGSHSDYDPKLNRFNEIYHIFNIEFDLKNFYSNKTYDFIPFKGKIPKEILSKISKQNGLEIQNNIIKTYPISFTIFIISLHDFYINIYHDANYKTLAGKEKDIILYCLNKYLKSNQVNIHDINKLSQIINDYYKQNINSDFDYYDEMINCTLKEIDNHTDLTYKEVINYKEIVDKPDLLIRDYRIGSSYTLMNRYYLNSNDIQNILSIFDEIFFNNIVFQGDNILEIIRYAKEKFNNEYQIKDFNKGINNLEIVYEKNLDGYKKLLYNLNTHQLIVQLVNSKINFKKTKQITTAEKELLLYLITNVLNIINTKLRHK